MPTLGAPAQDVLASVLAAQPPPGPDLTASVVGQGGNEFQGVLLPLGQAEDPLPAQGDHLADGVSLLVLAPDATKDDLAVPFDPRQDLQKADLQFADRERRPSRAISFGSTKIPNDMWLSVGLKSTSTCPSRT